MTGPILSPQLPLVANIGRERLAENILTKGGAEKKVTSQLHMACHFFSHLRSQCGFRAGAQGLGAGEGDSHRSHFYCCLLLLLLSFLSEKDPGSRMTSILLHCAIRYLFFRYYGWLSAIRGSQAKERKTSLVGINGKKGFFLSGSFSPSRGRR